MVGATIGAKNRISGSPRKSDGTGFWDGQNIGRGLPSDLFPKDYIGCAGPKRLGYNPSNGSVRVE